MKTISQLIIIVLILPIFLLACNRNEEEINAKWDLFACHHDSSWDSLSIQNTLIGEWEWEYVSCFNAPALANGEDFNGLSVEFKSDNTLDVFEDGQLTQTSNWEVEVYDTDDYGIRMNPAVSQLHGLVLICGERVEFKASIVDVCDNFFVRIN